MRRVERLECMYQVRFVAVLRRMAQPSRVARAFLQALRDAHAPAARPPQRAGAPVQPEAAGARKAS